MKINKLAWSAFQSGVSSRQLKEMAREKLDYFVLWTVLALAVAYCFWSEWALLPAILATVNGVRGVLASRLVPEIEAIESLIRNPSRG